MSVSPFHDPTATWNQRYSQESYLFGTEPSRWLVSQRAWLPPNGRVLAVADGEGRNSVWMASQGLKVDAFDISEVAVAKARRLAATRGVDVRHAVMDADAVQWPRAVYDAAVAIFIQFADPAARQRLFRRCAAALKPGGVFLLHGYTPRQLEYRTGGPPIRSHLFYRGPASRGTRGVIHRVGRRVRRSIERRQWPQRSIGAHRAGRTAKVSL